MAGQVVNLAGKGRVWRKQILPLGSINYNGRQIKFDSGYHQQLVRNFRAGAYPQVPFQLADADNRHTNDPERTRGELVDLRAEPTGLYGYFKLPDPSVVLNNGNLGVSCRIIENYTRESDGKEFGHSLQHVLGTLDPRITGMKPWESVELSSELTDLTVDFSNQFYTKDGGAMPQADEDKHVVELSTAQLEKLNQLLGGGENGNTGKPDEGDDFDFGTLTPDMFEDGDEDETDESDDPPGAGAGDGPDSEEEAEPDLQLAAIQNLQGQVLELTNRLSNKDAEVELAQLEATGLAPAIIQAARPLLAIQDGVIELSGGKKVSPSKQVRKLLRTILDLSNRGLDVVSLDQEKGSLSGGDPATELRSQMVDEMDRLYGS